MNRWQCQILRMTRPIGSIKQQYSWDVDIYSLFMELKEELDGDVE